MQSNTENEFLKSLHDKLDNLEYEASDQLWESTFERYQEARERKRRFGIWFNAEKGDAASSARSGRKRRPVMWIWSGIGGGAIAAGITMYLLFGSAPVNNPTSPKTLQEKEITAEAPAQKGKSQAQNAYPQGSAEKHTSIAKEQPSAPIRLSKSSAYRKNYTLKPAAPVSKTPVPKEIPSSKEPVNPVVPQGSEEDDILTVTPQYVPESEIELAAAPEKTAEEIKNAENASPEKPKTEEVIADQPEKKQENHMRPKDSAIKVEKPVKEKRPLPPSYWVVGAQYNLEQNFRTLSQKGNINAEYMGIRNNRESASFTNSGGLFAEYNIHGMLGINLGVSYSNISFSNNYGTISTVVKDSIGIYDPNTGALLGYVYTMNDTVFQISPSHSAYEFVSIPLQLSFTPIQTKHLSVSLIGGAAARISVNRTGTTINPYDLAPIDIKEGSRFIKYNPVNWSYHFGFSVNYFIGDHIRLGVQPVIRQSVNSLYVDKFPVKELLTSKGVNFSLGYKF